MLLILIKSSEKKMSKLLPGTPFFIQLFHHTPFILAHTLLPVHLCVRCGKKGNLLCDINSLLLALFKQIIITSFHATHGTVLSPSRVACDPHGSIIITCKHNEN